MLRIYCFFSQVLKTVNNSFYIKMAVTAKKLMQNVCKTVPLSPPVSLCAWVSVSVFMDGTHCGLPLAEHTCYQEWSVSEDNEEQPVQLARADSPSQNSSQLASAFILEWKDISFMPVLCTQKTTLASSSRDTGERAVKWLNPTQAHVSSRNHLKSSSHSLWQQLKTTLSVFLRPLSLLSKLVTPGRDTITQT